MRPPAASTSSWSGKCFEVATLHGVTNLSRLARIGGVQPIGSLQTSVTIEGHTWELWVGMNGSMKVFSFVAPTPVNNFNADIKQFWNYLAKAQNFPADSQYLLSMYIQPNDLSSY